MNISGGNRVTEFILLSFSSQREIQILLCRVFFLTYVLTLMGKGSIISVVRLDHQLHSPMYLLLANFSFLEISYLNTTVPNMLANFLSETKTISFTACFLQFYFFFSTGAIETFFLSLMAFDRYLAICQPLHCLTIMTGHFCIKLVFLFWVSGFLYFPVPICFMTQLPFCGPNIIDHFVCDPGPLLSLSCAPTPEMELLCSIFNCFLIYVTFPFILVSFSLVFKAVLKAPSAAGWKKAFFICGSHLIMVSLFYGNLMVMYIRPNSGNAVGSQKIFTLFYSVVTPPVNPLIYKLCNKEMKTALRKV